MQQRATGRGEGREVSECAVRCDPANPPIGAPLTLSAPPPRIAAGDALTHSSPPPRSGSAGWSQVCVSVSRRRVGVIDWLTGGSVAVDRKLCW